MDTAAASEDKPLVPSVGDVLPHFLPVAAFPLMFAAAAYGGWWLLAPYLFFMSVGPLDLAFGREGRNMDPRTTSESQVILYSVPVWLWALLWPIICIFTLWNIFVIAEYAWWENALLAVMLALEGQAIFIVGHELIHRRSKWERYVAEFLLATGSYPHYATEHFYIHHAHAGTPLDTGSAFKGQTFWSYLPTELLRNFTGAWEHSRKRMARRNLPVWNYRNPFWRYGIETALCYAFVFALGGIHAVFIYMLFCLFAVTSMKIANYIQHYGLRRIRLPNGRFETVRAHHSWSSNYRYSKWMFFNYQRHADHHVIASRQYPVLQHHGEDLSPQLPTDYVTLLGWVLRPKKWFEKMDPLVDQWRDRFYPEISDWRPYESRVTQAHPEAFEVIAELYENAPKLAAAVEKTPELLDSLQSREFTDLEIPGGFGVDAQQEIVARSGLIRVYWTYEMSVDEMKHQLKQVPVQDAFDAAQMLCNWSNDKMFQVAIHYLRGNLTVIEVSQVLSNIAEASIATLCSAVFEDIEESSYHRNSCGLALIAHGDLASGELSPDCPIGLTIVQSQSFKDSYADFQRRFCQALRLLGADSLVFRSFLDKGSNIAQYVLNDVTGIASGRPDEMTWLTRARCIFTTDSGALPARFEEIRREILTSESFRQCHVRHQDETGVSFADRGESVFEVSEQGLRQIEGIARQLQSRMPSHTVHDPAGGDVKSIVAAAREHELIGSSVSEDFLDAYRLFRSINLAWRLVLGDGFDPRELTDSIRSLLGRSCNTADHESLQDRIGHACAAISPDKFVADPQPRLHADSS